MSSHRIVHYGLRPAKNIERKMICEACQRLAHFRNLLTYQYVGFGSRYFSDFTLVHRVLGIGKMISIERNSSDKDWFEFNKPYNCIEAIYDHSNVALPTIDWTVPTILWLDYDGRLGSDVFADIQTFCTSAVDGSVMLITVNAEASRPDSGLTNDLAELRIRELRDAVGEVRVPGGTTGRDLSKKDLPGVLRKIVDNEIRETIAIRNGGLMVHERLQYQQLFNFVYDDGAQMLTVGGVIYREDQVSTLEKCSFVDYHYVRQGEQACRIEVPNLTFREIHHLNRHLPLGGQPPLPFIPQKEISQYALIYRYFPTFTEAEV